MTSLFDYLRVRPTDPETSRQAARRNPAGKEIDANRVLQAHLDHPGGLSDFELAKLIDRKQTSAGKRRGELRDRGLIEATNMRGRSDTGSPTIVWRLTPAGRWLAEAQREPQ